MHNFDYRDTPRTLLTPEVINMLTKLHELKGKQELYIEAEPDVLSSLLNLAKIQSTKSSNKIEGIWTSDERLEAIVKEKSEPRNRSEEEISGYRDVLATIHESYEYISVRPNSILQFHRDLYAFSSSSVGGSFKNSDNVIAEIGKDGKSKARFVPVTAFQTPQAVQDLCDEFNNAIESGLYDPLVLIPMFVLDFLCIHPFNDGNGRMSRLLTLLLLYRSGYIVGKYISIEMLIEKSKETYYETLKQSSISWHENNTDYLPFVKYYLGAILKAYYEFEDRVEYLHHRNLNKSDRVKAVFDRKIGKITKTDIAELCPDISITTIERSLNALLQSGYIKKYGKSRGTFYVKNTL
jgi:Uncharacterized conserved protein